MQGDKHSSFLVFERECMSEGVEIYGSIAHEMTKIIAKVKKRW
jgi:hypothetical protein